MVVKQFDAYSKKEQIVLLSHWWNDFGKKMHFLDGSDEVMKFIEEEPEQMLTLAVAEYIGQMNKDVLLSIMQDHKAANIYQNVWDIRQINEEFRSIYQCIEENFIALLVEDYQRSLEKRAGKLQEVQPAFQMLGFTVQLRDGQFVVYDAAKKEIGLLSPVASCYETLALETKRGSLSCVTVASGKEIDGTPEVSHIVKLDSLAKMGDDLFVGNYVNIEIGKKIRLDRLVSRMQVKVIDPNADFITTEFTTDDCSFSAGIDNGLGSLMYGGDINGSRHHVIYEDIDRTNNPGTTYFMAYRSERLGDASYIELRDNYSDEEKGRGYTFEAYDFVQNESQGNRLKQSVAKEEVVSLANQLLAVDDTKHFVGDVLNHIEHTLPGFNAYIRNQGFIMPSVLKTMETNNYGVGSSLLVQDLFVDATSSLNRPEQIVKHK